jgi:hypothetical protein
MYFGTKSYLKSNRNHTAKHTLRLSLSPWILGPRQEDFNMPLFFYQTTALVRSLCYLRVSKFMYSCSLEFETFAINRMGF